MLSSPEKQSSCEWILLACRDDTLSYTSAIAYPGRLAFPGEQKQEEMQVMGSRVAEEVDFIEELKLRRWAREHYVTNDQRQSSWHPVVLDEMAKKDRERNSLESLYTPA